MRSPTISVRKGHRGSAVTLAVWILGFLVGTGSHIVDLAIGGLNTYAQFPTGLRIYWVSLTFLDPLTIALLALRRRVGVVLGLAVILSDITVNWTVYLTVSGNPLWGLVNQTVFAAIVVTTSPILWRRFGGDAHQDATDRLSP